MRLTMRRARARLIAELVDGHYDMVVGVRVNPERGLPIGAAHQFGNRLLTGFVASIFGKELRDMLSGYRVFSRRFVKSFPAAFERL